MNAALKLTCVAFGVCAGVWLAGSAYFLVGSRDAAPVEFPAREELAPAENAFPLIRDLHRLQQTNFNFSVAYRYVRGMTNGPAAAAEMDALIAAHSNLITTVSKILACRGVQVPVGEPRGEIGWRLGGNAVMPLLRVKAFREAERGETAAAHATVDMMLDFAQFLAASKSILSYSVGMKSYANMAFEVGSERPVADERDQPWLTHLMRRAETLEGQSKRWCSQASAGELTAISEHLERMKGIRRVASFLRGYPASFESMKTFLRKPRSFDVDVEWGEVRARCCTSLLLLFAGYADYSLQPNATWRCILEQEKILQAKLAEPAFDRAYAMSASYGRRLAQPLRPNWYGSGFLCQDHYWVEAYTRYFESLFNLRARRVLLACKVYRGQKGHLPARLEDLVPAILPAVPLDPYDGKPLRYEPKPGYIWTPGKKGDFDGKVRYNRYGELRDPLLVGRSVRWIDAVRDPSTVGNGKKTTKNIGR